MGLICAWAKNAIVYLPVAAGADFGRDLWDWGPALWLPGKAVPWEPQAQKFLSQILRDSVPNSVGQTLRFLSQCYLCSTSGISPEVGHLVSNLVSAFSGSDCCN